LLLGKERVEGNPLVFHGLDELRGEDDAVAVEGQVGGGLRPDSPEAHLHLGHALYGQGRLQEAEAALRQARIWLRADLAAYARWAKGDDPKQKAAVRQRLAHWQQDAALAPVRDKAVLDQLPEAERAAWRRLWANVESLRQEVSGEPGPGKLRSGGRAERP
jgi:hypothetical protein